MRFIPITHMQSGQCMEATSNGGVSGSFTSGSETYVYHEFTSPAVNTSGSFQFTVTKGFTNRARLVVIGGGGGGGWDGTLNAGRGGGGGGASVINQVGQLYQGTYSIMVGQGGDPADADNVTPVLRTYNGGDGGFSEILGGPYTGTDRLKSLGGEGGYGDATDSGTYLFGGDSANGNSGGSRGGSVYAGGGGGFTTAGSNGIDGASENYTGNGGLGTTINLPYTSPSWGAASKGVGGGGAGYTESTGESITQGSGSDGGGSGTVDGERYSGGGGGGARDFPATPPAGEGTTGGDGIVIIYYPTGSCQQFQPVEAINLRTGSEACFLTSSEQVYFYHDENDDGVMGVGDYLYYDSKSAEPLPNGTKVTNAGTSFFVTGTDGRITSQSIECLEVYNIISNNTGSGGLSGSYDVNFDMGTENSIIMWMSGSTEDTEVVELKSGDYNFQFLGDRVNFPTRFKMKGQITDGTTTATTGTGLPFYTSSLWYMHVVTWDETTGDLKNYYNTDLVSSASFTDSMAGLQAGQLNILENGIQNPLATNVGEVRVYAQALDSSQITSIYNDTKGRYGL